MIRDRDRDRKIFRDQDRDRDRKVSRPKVRDRDEKLSRSRPEYFSKKNIIY